MGEPFQLTSVCSAGEHDPSIVLVGCDAGGGSAALVVLGFEPYFFVCLPAMTEASARRVGDDVFASLNLELTRKSSKLGWRCAGVSIEHRTPADRYRPGGATPVLKLRFGESTTASRAARLLQAPLGDTAGAPAWLAPEMVAMLLGRDVASARAAAARLQERRRPEGEWGIPTAEACVSPGDRLLADCGVPPESWVDWAGAKPGSSPKTTCAREGRIHWKQLRRAERTGDALKRLMCFDIETLPNNVGAHMTTFYAGDAPGACCIAIGAVSCRIDGSDRRSVVFNLEPGATGRRDVADEHGGLTVVSCPTEADVLTAFSAHVRDIDPDIFVGYNTHAYDWEWLDRAATRLGLADLWRGWGRVVHDSTLRRKEFRFDPKRSRIQCSGRVSFDLLEWLHKNVKLRSYKLGEASPRACRSREFFGRLRWSRRG